LYYVPALFNLVRQSFTSTAPSPTLDEDDEFEFGHNHKSSAHWNIGRNEEGFVLISPAETSREEDDVMTVAL
jgi:hypothetical protein